MVKALLCLLLLLPYLVLIAACWRLRTINRRLEARLENMRAALDLARLEKFTTNYRADVARMREKREYAN